MRLVALAVEQFAALRRAQLAFGPGLNVLYGPNDLGKSTLVAAIRAGLLLPHRSRSHESFIGWGSDATPQVELVLQAPDQRYWRIRKSFSSGAGGAATLESSKDGNSFQSEAKGRKVDSEIRRLLRWGIADAGAGGQRGLPDSFLASVLLPEQTATGEIFTKGFGGDRSESGKQQLEQALQALAQDPQFKQVLDAAQGRVDEAFTATGQRRRGRNDPFRVARERIVQARSESEQAREELRQSEDVEAKIQELREAKLEAEGQRTDLVADLQELERRWYGERCEAVLRAEATLQGVEQRQAESHKQEEGARKALDQAQSKDRARERELQKAQLGHRRLEITTQLQSLSEIRSQAVRVRDLESEQQGLRGQKEQLQQRKAQHEKEGEVLAQRCADLLEREEMLRGVGLLLQWQRARREAEQAAEAAKQAQEDARQAEGALAQAQELEQRWVGWQPPSVQRLQDLKKADAERMHAEARLSVGLCVNLQLRKQLDLRLQKDGQSEEKRPKAKGKLEIEGERRVQVQLGDWGSVEVVGGDAAARRKAERAQQRWQEEVAPLLETAGVRSLEEWEARCKQAEQDAAQARHLRSQGELLAGRAVEKSVQAEELERLRDRLVQREAALQLLDRALLERQARGLGDDVEGGLEAERTEVQSLLQEAQALRQSNELQRAGACAEMEGVEEQLKKIAPQQQELSQALQGSWQEQMAAIDADREELRSEQQTIEQQLDEIEQTVLQALHELEQALREAQELSQQASAEHLQARRELEEVRGHWQRARGLLESRGWQDLDAIAAADAKGEDSAKLLEESPVSDEQLLEAREAMEAVERVVREKTGEIGKLQGALELVGGEVAREHSRLAQEALLRAEESESELDLDYSAWQLLLKTLREVEDQQSSHLGRALMDPITEQFARLTEGRYGELLLAPDLKTEGIEAGGDLREVEVLSVGVQEQLATVFRLTLAQQLGSMLVLDDQLAQTDAGRTSWFRQLFQERAQSIQVLVFTCRPQDYLSPDEMPAAGQSTRDLSGIQVRAVDLTHFVKRAVPPGSASAIPPGSASAIPPGGASATATGQGS